MTKGSGKNVCNLLKNLIPFTHFTSAVNGFCGVTRFVESIPYRKLSVSVALHDSSVLGVYPVLIPKHGKRVS